MLGLILTAIAFSLFITKRYYESLLFYFFFITYGYLIIPPTWFMAGVPLDKPTDFSLLYIVSILGYRFDTVCRLVQHERLFRWLLALVVFVCISAFYSVVVMHYRVGDVLKVGRNYLFYLSFAVFIMVPLSELKKFLHALAVITVLQSVVYLVQIPVGIKLLGSTISSLIVNKMENSGWVRYYNTPGYVIPALFYFLFVHRYESTAKQWLVVGILVTTVVAPMHRSYIMIIALVASLYVLSRQSNRQRVMYIAIVLTVIYGASTLSIVQSRLTDGMNDVGKTLSMGRSIQAADYSTEDTFSYRMAHFFERFNYVMGSPERVLFGVSMLSEETAQAEKLSFEAGLFSERLGRITQIETADIVWSLTILHLGLAGTLLFIILLVKLGQFFYRHRFLPVSTLGLLSLVTFVCLSFTGTELILIPFRTLLMLLVATVAKEARQVTALPAGFQEWKQPEPLITRAPQLSPTTLPGQLI